MHKGCSKIAGNSARFALGSSCVKREMCEVRADVRNAFAHFVHRKTAWRALPLKMPNV